MNFGRVFKKALESILEDLTDLKFKVNLGYVAVELRLMLFWQSLSFKLTIVKSVLKRLRDDRNLFENMTQKNFGKENSVSFLNDKNPIQI